MRRPTTDLVGADSMSARFLPHSQVIFPAP